jgi:2-polyprenyl-3-methyl-5-hydroxy-6-metoxy-1,4-benzoquinol methylase
VTTYPKDFVPDVRRLRPWPTLHESLWRNPGLVNLTYSELARSVEASIGPAPCRVLYVGPGLGHIALELARSGHHVTGVDGDEEVVSVARRAAETDPFLDTRGSLSYEVAEFPGEFGGKGPYDKVLFSRVLHHIADPSAAVAKADELLGDDGTIVCFEFAHDRLDRTGARWMAASVLWLATAGWWSDTSTGSLKSETEKTARQWQADHEREGLNSFQEMIAPLRSTFSLRRLTWHPYLFWDLAAEMRVPAEQEVEVAVRLRDQEAALLAQGRLQGVLFSTIGERRTAV